MAGCSYWLQPAAVSVCVLAVVLLRGMNVGVRNQLSVAIGFGEGKQSMKNYLPQSMKNLSLAN
jgi:hypothetical protein